MTRHYLLLVFLLSLSALQLGASVGGVRGLWLLGSKRWNMALAIGLGISGLVIFTMLPLWTDGPWAAGSVADGTSEGRQWGVAAFADLTRARNLNDIHGGLNGGDYGAWFPLTALGSVVVSALVGALRIGLLGGEYRRESTYGLPEDSVPVSSLVRMFRIGSLGGETRRTSSHDLPEGFHDLPEGFDALGRGHWFDAARISLWTLRATVWRDLVEMLRETPPWTIPRLIAKRWLRD